MKQKKIILRNITNENLTTTLPASIRLYNNEGNMLELKEGAIPFFLKLYETSTGSVLADFVNIKTQIIENNRRLSKEYFRNNFWIYKIADYGNQSLSYGLQDFLPKLFDESTGKKIKQYNFAMIKNYVSKEIFILIPKTLGEFTLTIIIEPKSSIKKLIQSTDQNQITLTRPFTLNLKTSDVNINDLNEIDIYVIDGTTEYRLTNSDYFFSITKDEFPSGVDPIFVAQQQTFFTGITKRDVEKQSNIIINKEIQDINITLNDNLNSINSIILKSRQNNPDFIYTNIDNITNRQLITTGYTFEKVEDAEIYKESNGYLTKLIPGIDYYINTSKKIVLPTETTSVNKYEIFFKSGNSKKITKAFTRTTDYDVINSIYFSNIKDWNIDLANSTVTIFENGVFFNKGNLISGFNYDNRYEIVVEDIVLGTVTTPTANTSKQYEITNTNTFNNFNKYQAVMDPNFVSYGESGTLSNIQEVFLYDTSLNMLLDLDEPTITINKNDEGITNYLIQNLEDPYPSLLTPLITNYTEYQSTNPLINKLKLKLNNESIQNIETDINTIKTNLLKTIANSTLSYLDYSSNVYTVANGGIGRTQAKYITKSNFMFLLVKKINATKPINITYFTNINDIYNSTIKKEYECEFIHDLYISIPICSENNELYILIEYSDSSNFDGQYYLFK